MQVNNQMMSPTTRVPINEMSATAFTSRMTQPGTEATYVRKTHKKSSNVARLSNITSPEIIQLLGEAQIKMGLSCQGFNFDGQQSEGVITFNTDGEAKRF